MKRDVLLLREGEIRKLLDPMAGIAAMERAFAAYSSGRAELPSVIHLDVREFGGEIHVKAGYLHGGRYYAVKMVSGFASNPAHGLPANDGMVMVFDARTGAPAGILLDNGYITDFRTAAAGAVAVKHLARKEVRCLAVIGSGGQARYQAEMAAKVRDFDHVRVWGRNPEKARACVEGLAASGLRAEAAESVELAVAEAEVVITVTASREPLVKAEWLRPGTTVVAVGADGAEKQELDVNVLARADRVVADSVAQCVRLGEIYHAVERGAIAKDSIVELGEITGGRKPGRVSEDEVIVCDLTGVGVQDVAAAGLVMELALAGGIGERVGM
jgi:ornithine cyclodeaminase